MANIPHMDKKQVINFFGSQVNLAKAVRVSPPSVTCWPDPLPRRIADRVIAACVRKGIDPTPLLEMEEGTGGDDERNQ